MKAAIFATLSSLPVSVIRACSTPGPATAALAAAVGAEAGRLHSPGAAVADVIRGYHFAGDPRAFAILGRSLPL